MKNYFKKFSIMFVMTLAIIGVGIINNGTVANAATVGQQLIQPEDGWTRYDDNDSRIKYFGKNWTPYASDGYSNGSLHYLSTNSDNANNKVKINFYGSNIRLILQRAGDYSSNFVIIIDGIEYPHINLATGSEMVRYLAFEKLGLELKVHTIELKSLNDRWAFDAIDIESTGKLLTYEEISNISLNKSTDNLQVGQMDNLVATTTPVGSNVVWLSSDKSIATVDSNGKVTAVKEGIATITSQIKGTETKAICTVTVTNVVSPPNSSSSITIDKSITKLIVGDTQRLTATTTPAGLDSEWTSSDSSIVEVKQDGTINAKAAGTAIIIAKIKGTDISATCVVTVTKQGNTDVVNSSGGTTNSYGILNWNTPSGFTQSNNNGGNNNGSTNSGNNNNSGNSGNNYSNNNNSNSNNNYYYYNNYYLSFNTKA